MLKSNNIPFGVFHPHKRDTYFENNKKVINSCTLYIFKSKLDTFP